VAEAGGASTEPAWSAVVVNYEYGPRLVTAVDSILADTSGGRVEVVVVDNGSSDGSVAALRIAHPEITVVDPGRNLGYAGGANAGIARTSAPVVAVCNADLTVHAGTAGAMCGRLAREADVGAVGPTVLEPDGTRYPSGRLQPSLVDAVGHAVLGPVVPNNRFTRHYHESDADPSVPRDVDWISGAAMWFRRRALESVGGWDDGYFMYVEEVDLCWRLRAAGWRIVYDPTGAITHERGVATAQRPVRMIVEHHRSWYRFASKRWRGPRRLLLPVAAVFLALRATVLIALQGLAAASRRPRAHG